MKVPVSSILGTTCIVILCLVAGVIGGGLTRHFGMSSYTLSYADFISILLSAISVLMTVLAIFFAILGVIGWTAISKGMHDRAKEYLEDAFKEGNRLDQLVRGLVASAAYEGIRAIDEDAKSGAAEAAQQGTNKKGNVNPSEGSNG